MACWVNAVTVDQVQRKDTRRHRRFPFRGVVQLQGRYGETLHAFDLSVGGVGIYSDRALGIARTIEVVLWDGSVRVRGVVRYELQTKGRGWRIGIQFAEPQPELLAVALSLPADLT